MRGDEIRMRFSQHERDDLWARLRRILACGAVLLLLTVPALGEEAPPPGASGKAEPAADREPDHPEESDPFDLGAKLIPRPLREMRINGVFQGDLSDGSLRASSATSNTPVRNGIGAFPVDSRLEIRRATLNCSVPLGADAAFKFSLPFESGLASGSTDAYFQIRLPEDVSLLAGRYKVRWGYEGMRGSWNTNTIERTDATVGLYQFRDTGFTVMYGATDAKLRAEAGVFLGEGQNNHDVRGLQNVVYRFAWRPSLEWVVNFSGQYGIHNTADDGAKNPQILPVRRHNLGVRCYSGPWTFESELMESHGYNFTSKADTPAAGGYVAGVRKLSESFDAVLEYDWFDPNTSECDTKSPNNETNARNRTVVGVNFYLDRESYQRIMVNYEFHGEAEGPRVSNDGLRVRYQFRF